MKKDFDKWNEAKKKTNKKILPEESSSELVNLAIGLSLSMLLE